MRKAWESKEKKDAKAFNGKRMPRSGGFWSAKGDIKSGKYLIESKQTMKRSFSVSVDLWKKIEREALLSNRIPLLSLEIGKEKQELIVISRDDFLTL